MDPATGLRTRLSLPPISQIGIVVRDMQKAVEYYQDVFGLGAWTVYASTPNKY